MQLFSKGDVVVLKSGSPKMTVKEYTTYHNGTQEVESRDEVVCVWFNGPEMKESTFRVETLELAE